MVYLETIFIRYPVKIFPPAWLYSLEYIHSVAFTILAVIVVGLLAMSVLAILLIIGLSVFEGVCILSAVVKADMVRSPSYYVWYRYGGLIRKHLT